MKHLERFVWGVFLLLALLVFVFGVVGFLLVAVKHPIYGAPVLFIVLAYILGLIKTKFDDGTIK